MLLLLMVIGSVSDVWLGLGRDGEDGGDEMGKGEIIEEVGVVIGTIFTSLKGTRLRGRCTNYKYA